MALPQQSSLNLPNFRISGLYWSMGTASYYPPAAPRPFRAAFPDANILQAYDRGGAYFLAYDVPYLLNFVAVVVLVNYVLGVLLRPSVQICVLGWLGRRSR